MNNVTYLFVFSKHNMINILMEQKNVFAFKCSKDELRNKKIDSSPCIR